MISFIKGKLIEKGENFIVVESNNIGFELFVSSNTFAAMPFEGEIVEIFSHMNVKENEISLFGFASKEERNMFYKLTTVNGVGPKSALSVLSGLPLSQLISAIATEDLALLQKVKGLGKKTAEKIVLELKDKVDIYDTIRVETNLNPSALAEAIEVLVSLGISKSDATQIARQNANADSSAEEIVSAVLQNMGR